MPWVFGVKIVTLYFTIHDILNFNPFKDNEYR